MDGTDRAVGLFRGLDERLSAAMLRGARRVRYRKGEALWVEGEPASRWGIVESGFVKMVKTSPVGRDTIIELLGPRDVTGLLAALEEGTFPLSAVALTPCVVLACSAEEVRRLARVEPTLQPLMVGHIAPRLRRAHEMMSRLAVARVETRLAGLLLELAAKSEPGPDGARTIGAPLTRRDLAEMAGTTVETAIRITSQWQKAGLMEVEARRITLRDPAALEALTRE